MSFSCEITISENSLKETIAVSSWFLFNPRPHLGEGCHYLKFFLVAPHTF